MKKAQKDKICKACDNVIIAIYENLRYFEFMPTDDDWMNAWLKDMKYYIEISHSDNKAFYPILTANVSVEYKIEDEITLKSESVLGSYTFTTRGSRLTRFYFRSMKDVYYFLYHVEKQRSLIDLFYKKIPYEKFYSTEVI